MRERLFHALATLIERRRGLVFAICAGVFAASMYLVVTGLTIDSSRHALVDEEAPEQVRLMRFNARFGTNDILVLVEGGPLAERRAAMDHVAKAILDAELAENATYRVDLAAMSHVAVWYLPLNELKRLADGVESLGKGGQPSDKGPLALQGVHDIIKRMNEGLEAFADGDTGTMSKPDLKPADLEAATEMAEGVIGELDSWLKDDTKQAFGLSELRKRAKGPVGLDDAGYVSIGDENALLMRIRGRGDVIDPKVANPLIDRISDTLRQYLPEGATFGIAGIPAIVSDENRTVTRDMSLTGTVSAVGCLLLFLLAYRTFSGMLVIMVALFAGIGWGMGYAVLAIDKMTMFTSSFLVIIIGMGIDFGVHLFTRIRIERLAGSSPQESVRTALVGTGPPIIIGALTSAAAFGVMAFTEFRGTHELGIMAAGALVAVLLSSFILIPALLGRPNSRMLEAKDGPRQSGLRLCLPYSMRYAALALGIAVTVWTASAIRPIEWDLDTNNMLPQDTPAIKTLYRLKDLGLGQVEFAGLEAETMEEIRRHYDESHALIDEGVVERVESLIDVLPPDLDAKAPLVARIRQAASGTRTVRFEAAESIDAVALVKDLDTLRELLEEDVPFALAELGEKTPLPYIARLAQKVTALHQTAQSLKAEQLTTRLGRFESLLATFTPGVDQFLRSDRPFQIDDLPASMLAAYRSTDDGRVSYATRVYPKGNVADAAFVRDFRRRLRAVDDEATGYAINYAYFGEIFARSFWESLLYASILVLLLVWFDMRNLRDTFLSLLPLILGATWMVGMMHIIGVGFSFANGVSIPLILGIGVDSGVHLVHAWREHGHSVKDAVRTSGKAIVVSSMTTMIAFGSMSLAHYEGLKSLGLVLLLGVSACLFATLFVLPAVLYLVSGSASDPDGATTAQ